MIKISFIDELSKLAENKMDILTLKRHIALLERDMPPSTETKAFVSRALDLGVILPQRMFKEPHKSQLVNALKDELNIVQGRTNRAQVDMVRNRERPMWLRTAQMMENMGRAGTPQTNAGEGK